MNPNEARQKNLRSRLAPVPEEKLIILRRAIGLAA